jgi:hypothetical protein
MSNQQRVPASRRKPRIAAWWNCGDRTFGGKLNAAKKHPMLVIGDSNLETRNASLHLTANARRERRPNAEVVPVILAAIPQGS